MPMPMEFGKPRFRLGLGIMNTNSPSIVGLDKKTYPMLGVVQLPMEHLAIGH